MSEYRKLTDFEVRLFGIRNTENAFDKKCRNVAIKYYKNPYMIERIVSSEYNDNTYDNRFTAMYVYDKDGNELTPSKEQIVNAQREIDEIEFYMNNTYDYQEPSSFILVDHKIPDLYIKI
jgi:hypothetical protein